MLVLDDPRLGEAKKLALAGKGLEAATAIDEASSAGVDAATSARWRYRSALLRKQGGDPGGAASAFEKAAGTDGPLKPYALLEAAELRLASNDDARALADLGNVDPHAVPRTRFAQAMARALVRSGKLDDGLKWYDELASRKHDKTWAANTLELARVLLNHPAQGRAAKTVELAIDVELDGPTSLEGEAIKIKKEAEGDLPSKERDAYEHPPSDDVYVDRVKRLVASGRAKKALGIIESLLKSYKGVCELYQAHAEALAALDRPAEASAAFDKTLAACKTAELNLTAHVISEAATAAIRAGDLELAQRRLDALADTLAGNGPDILDPRFAMARELMKQGDWARASNLLTLSIQDGREQSYQRAGRFPYFHGRALLALHKEDEAALAFEETLRDYPLTYYSALAYARLEELKPGRGKEVMLALLKKEPPVAPAGPSDEVRNSPAFQAAIALACEDDVPGVMSALDALGVMDRSATPDVTLAAAEILARTSTPSAAHLLLRTASEHEPSPSRFEASAFRETYPIGAYRGIWELDFPRPYKTEVETAAKESSVPEALIYAITREESAFDPRALSRAGAIGLTQVMPTTARNGAKRLGLPFTDAAVRDPGENLRLGAHFLKKMRDDFPDDPLLAIPAYNAGPGAPEKWAKAHPDASFDLFVEDIPFTETRNYTKRVIASLFAYEVLYGSLDASEAAKTPKLARSSQ